LRPFS